MNTHDIEQQRAAFAAYLKDCDHHAIVPDTAGAFNYAWTAAIERDRQGRGDPVAGERFLRAWVNLDKLPGTMMVGPKGIFGPIAASTSCWITTCEREAERLKAKGPVLEIWATPQPPDPVKVPRDDEVLDLVKSYGNACANPEMTAAEREMRLHDIRALLEAAS